jgi:hypothetical protein
VRRYVIAGLLVWVPILVTVLVVRFILDLMDQTLLLLPASVRPEALFGVHIPGLGLVLAVLLLIFTGMLVSNIIGRSLVGLWEDLMNRIPFVRALYSGVKSFSTTILSNQGNSFKKVLLIEYPRKGLERRLSDRGRPAADQCPHRRAAGVRLHPDDAQSDLRFHRHGAALAGDRARHERRCGDEDDRDARRGCAARAHTLTFPAHSRRRQADADSLLRTGKREADRDHGRGGRLGAPAARSRRGDLRRPARSRGPGAGGVPSGAAGDVRHRGKAAHEFVVRVRGSVQPRPAGTVNANLASGQVEIVARELELLNRCDPLPFQLDESVSEEVRLRYRYSTCDARS